MEIRCATPVMIGQRIADGRDPNRRFWRETRDAVEHAETRSSELREAVRLLDGYGRLKAMYSTIQAAVSAATAGDQVSISSGVYAEDLRIHARVTLRRADARVAGKALVIGNVFVAASAAEVTVDGVAIDGRLTMETVEGVTAAIILRAFGIQGSGVRCAKLFRLSHVDE